MELHPECTLYQFGTLMNDNYLVKQKAIDEYRELFVERIDKGMERLCETFMVRPGLKEETIRDPCKVVPLSEVLLDCPVDKLSHHRIIFLVPSLPVAQKSLLSGFYSQSCEYLDIVKELADNVPGEI